MKQSLLDAENIPSFLGLIGSAIGGAAVIVTFTFMTFETKSEAQVEQDHSKTQQQEIKDDIHDLRVNMEALSEKLNGKLDRILYKIK